MTDDYTQYDLQRRRIEARYSRRRWLINHVGLFLIVNAAIWSQVLFSTYPWYSTSILDRVIFTVVWIGFIILHAINYRTSEQRDRALQHEMEQWRAWQLQAYPKAKRLALADDGELVDPPSEDWNEDEHRHKRK